MDIANVVAFHFNGDQEVRRCVVKAFDCTPVDPSLHTGFVFHDFIFGRFK